MLWFNHSTAQQLTQNIEITGTCSGVQIDEVPSLSGLFVRGPLGAHVWRDGDNACSKVIGNPGSTVQPIFQLQKRNSNGVFANQGGTSYNFYFGNLSAGTYRIIAQTPLPIIAPNCVGPTFNGRIVALNELGQRLGVIGDYNAGYNSVSNVVVVGKTRASDIKALFVGIAAGLSGTSYDYGDEVVLDVSQTVNYNRYRFAVSQLDQSTGATRNYKSGGWQNGTVESFNVTEFWAQNNWRLWAGYNYRVQVTIDNTECPNGIWQDRFFTFSVCPAGSGCRIVSPELPVVSGIYPNPANNTFIFRDFKPDLESQYLITIHTLDGKEVMRMAEPRSEVDVSDLTSNMYAVRMLENGKLIFSDKIIVN